jgi:hypothetical protein
VQKEIGRRLWQQLATQDWFSVPFSETYCKFSWVCYIKDPRCYADILKGVNPLHFTTKSPLHCDDGSMQPVPSSDPTITSYGSFLYRIACLMPMLQDRISVAPTLSAKYKEVLHFDKMMRELVLTQLPPPLNSQSPINPAWQGFVPLARRCLTITSAHKIIVITLFYTLSVTNSSEMIHRKFLGISFHDKRFDFTRKTCLAAAKTSE